MAERSLPTEGMSPIDGYLRGAGTRPVGYFEQYVDVASADAPVALRAIVNLAAASTGFPTSGLEVDIKMTGTPTLTNDVVGIRVSLQELGASIGYMVGMRIEKYNTNAGSLDCFLALQNQGSAVTTDMIYVGGTNKPTNLIRFQTANAGGCYDSGSGASSACEGHLAVKLGAVTRYLRLYTDKT